LNWIKKISEKRLLHLAAGVASGGGGGGDGL